MNTIYEGKKWICTVEVENKQSDYARCLQLILWLEKIAATGKTSGGEQPLEFYISRLLQASVNNANVLLQLEEYLANGEDKKIKKIVSENQLLAGLAKSEKSSLFHYYLRVKMNENTDISELQYMVLVLQTLPEIRDRIAIRLMGDIDYDWETRDYFRVSHFLRFVQEKHKCFMHAMEEKHLAYRRYRIVHSMFKPLSFRC